MFKRYHGIVSDNNRYNYTQVVLISCLNKERKKTFSAERKHYQIGDAFKYCVYASLRSEKFIFSLLPRLFRVHVELE